MVVETHYGRVRITDTEIYHNMGNGIKAKFLDGKWPFYEGETFCEEADLRANTYPYVISAIPTIKATSYCIRVGVTQNRYSSVQICIVYSIQCYVDVSNKICLQFSG